MLPNELQARHFGAYPAQAQHLALQSLALLQSLPLAFLPGLLRELIDYDYRFPAERRAIERELNQLQMLSAPQRQQWFQGFSALTLSDSLEQFDWVNHPAQFMEQESAHLWTTHQLDAFRAAATQYGDRLQASLPPEQLPTQRVGIAVVGRDVQAYNGALFRKLRPHGTLFTQVDPAGGLQAILDFAAQRAAAHAEPYAHWYIDGGTAATSAAALTHVEYRALDPVRSALLAYMQSQIARPGMGPEELRTNLARLLPTDLGMSAEGDPVLDRFQVRLFTEGSGTQIFSTTFAQWATREALRRAQPLTLLVRYAPRQRQRPMNEMLDASKPPAEVDPVGSLRDADMAAYYHWINQQRLSGADRSVFLVWFEGHNQALVVAPTLPGGSQSNSATTVAKLLTLATT
ncbi:MAG: hypothetical protein KGK08_07275 [Acidobacteriota bacterium]|nr:hypothetical protein [Acidobacteriota bacterium]